MFGDDEECMRAPSPWDGFMSSTPSEVGSLEAHRPLRNGIPKLAPEVEEGNVEYKLKLTDISPARFARLVTQLKWRLLEGGGQAYYELGVADSGALIGLSRADLEASLETLETMAGEIGASVVVVKEIEVPPAMAAVADKVSAYIDPATGRWTAKMSNKRFRSARGGPASGTETETEDTDTDDGPSLLATPDYPPARPAHLATPDARQPRSDPARPSAQSSPFLAPLDADLALFSMEPEPALADIPDDVPDTDTDTDTAHAPAPLPADADVPALALDIEIAAVYKPRPFRRRTPHPPGAAVFGGKHARRAAKPPRAGWNAPAQPASPHPAPASGPADADAAHAQTAQEAKALLRRQARDRRREEKRRALLAGAVAPDALPVPTAAVDAAPLPVPTAVDAARLADDAAGLAAGLAALHVTVEPAASPALTEGTLADAALAPEAREPRLIVEALVVRKMSLDEGFLDFGGFAVI